MLGDLVKQIPMAALVSVMIMVAYSTFDWASLKKLRTYPKSSNLVMIVTVLIVVFTHNLALGVFIGVLMSALFFAHKVSYLLFLEQQLSADKKSSTYKVYGQIFFASAEKFIAAFDFKEIFEKVTIDLSKAHFWDLSGVTALDKIVSKLAKTGCQIELIGLNQASTMMIEKLTIDDKAAAISLITKN